MAARQSRAASSWSIEATPKLMYDLNSGLSAVACPLTTTCIAVGSYVDTLGARQPLAEVWNGTTWTKQRTPRLARGGALVGVSCVSSTACTAVGDYIDSSGAQATLAERWNGTKWLILSAAAIGAASSAVLNDVSCTSASACMAVGIYVNSSGAGELLAEAWNGNVWSIHTDGFSASGGVLTAISCSAPSACTAVAGGTTLVERWNGVDWASQTLAIPGPPATLTELNGVTCTAANFCTAVGFWDYQKWYCNNGKPTCNCLVRPYCHEVFHASTLAEQWNGTSWVVEPTPGSGELYGVSCPTETDCIAVGEQGAPYAVQWNGSTWSTETVPDSAAGNLHEAACSAVADCVAVGNNGGVTLAARWNGTSWSIQQSVNPIGAATAQFAAVSCPTSTDCIAGGQYTQYTGSGGLQAALSEDWEGTSWKQQQLSPNFDLGSLSGVSCPGATTCTAVGPGNPPVDGPSALTGYGTSWSEQSLPLGVYNRGVPSGVSCPTTICMAVGFDFDYEQPSDVVPSGQMWNGSTWTLQTLPVPAGASSSLLSSVSCPTITDCTAVGDQGLSAPLAENWNGSGWTIQATPGSVALTGVSCPTTALCWAVGGNGSMVAEEWNGAAWTLQSLPAPIGATSTSLTGVSCPSASDCLAVGSFTNLLGKAMTLAEQWDGTGWSILPTPNPSGSIASYLSGVSCATVQTCTAVGYYVNTSNVDLTLAERFAG
jgi:hypothetical protein